MLTVLICDKKKNKTKKNLFVTSLSKITVDLFFLIDHCEDILATKQDLQKRNFKKVFFLWKKQKQTKKKTQQTKHKHKACI